MIFSASALPPDALLHFNGMTALAWSAFAAGSPSVIAGQWQVIAPSTTELMTSLHQHLSKTAAGQPSLAAALRQAVLRLKKSGEYQHPFYWAGFAVCGEGR
jgi:CHAT domain-containing protein